MLLYDVTYPHSRGLDRNVPWSYLQRIAARHAPSHLGAQAVCTNGEAVTLTLVVAPNGRDYEWR